MWCSGNGCAHPFPPERDTSNSFVLLGAISKLPDSVFYHPVNCKRKERKTQTVSTVLQGAFYSKDRMNN